MLIPCGAFENEVQKYAENWKSISDFPIPK